MSKTQDLDELLGEDLADAIAFIFEGDVLKFRPGEHRIAALGHVGAIPVYSGSPRELKLAQTRNQRLARFKQSAELAREAQGLRGSYGHQCHGCGVVFDPKPAPGTREGIGGVVAADCPSCGSRNLARRP